MHDKQMSFDFEEQENERQSEKEYLDTQWLPAGENTPLTPEATLLLNYCHIQQRRLKRILALITQSPDVVMEEDSIRMMQAGAELQHVYETLIKRTKE